MEYFIGLIPKKSSQQELQLIRDTIATNYHINDYRTNPILHLTVSYLKADSARQIKEILEAKQFQLQPMTLNVIGFERWENSKVVLTLDNFNLSGMINGLESMMGKYSANKEYREQVKQFYKGGNGNIENIGDHLKIIRNVDEQSWNGIKSDPKIVIPKVLTFDRPAVFNAQYSDVEYI